MAALQGREGVASLALAFTIFTGSPHVRKHRRAVGRTRSQGQDLDRASQPHQGWQRTWVPLSDRALQILKALPHEEGNPFVFIGPRTGGLSNMAMANVLDRMGRGDITVHGFRSSFMDWAHEQTAYPKVAIDQALAHAVGDKVEAAYRRGDLFDKRRRLMADWGKYCAQKPATKSASVVSLHGARA